MQSWIPHWFDIVTLGAFAWGIYCGRRHGISGELLSLLRWISVFFICGVFYRESGLRLASALHLNPNIAFVLVYIVLGCIVSIGFGVLARFVGNKLVTRDFFGNWEYYLGIATGMAKVYFILLVCLSLLSAKYVTEQDLYSMEAFQKENFGGITFPTLGEMKHESLTRSISGKVASRCFDRFLIAAVSPEEYQPPAYVPPAETPPSEPLEEWQKPEQPSGNQ